MKFADKLILLRKQKVLSQEELADILNVSRQAISRWELGATLPDASNLLALSDLFKVLIDYMLRDDYECDENISKSAEANKNNLASKQLSSKWFLIAFICWLVAALCYLVSAIINFVDGNTSFGVMHMSLVGVNIAFAVVFLVKCIKSNKLN